MTLVNNIKTSLYISIVTMCLMVLVFTLYNRLDYSDEFKNAPTVMNGCTDPGITAIVHSIDNYPNSWSSNQFRIMHKNGINIWTANEDYGLSIGKDHDDAAPDGYVMSEECRILLYSKIQEWKRNELNAILRK